MRRYGVADAYAQLKALTRGADMTSDTLSKFIAGLDVPEAAREKLAAMTPATYIGEAARLADDYLDGIDG